MHLADDESLRTSKRIYHPKSRAHCLCRTSPLDVARVIWVRLQLLTATVPMTNKPQEDGGVNVACFAKITHLAARFASPKTDCGRADHVSADFFRSELQIRPAGPQVVQSRSGCPESAYSATYEVPWLVISRSYFPHC